MCGTLERETDPFAKNAAAVLHYYSSRLSLFNDGSLSTVTDVERPMGTI